MDTDVKRFEVDGNNFEFDRDWDVLVYDKWGFYTGLSGGPLASKGCDLVALHDDILYLIEAKDYTYPPGTTMPKVQDLSVTVARKGFDTLAGIFAGAKLGGQHASFCAKATQCRKIVLCLSIEVPKTRSKLMYPDKLRAQLKERIGGVASYVSGRPLVVSNRGVEAPWRSSRATS